MQWLINSLSILAVMIGVGGLVIGSKASRFEGGAGMAGSFVFLIAAILSVVVAILLRMHWNELSTGSRIVGLLGCLPLLTVVLVLVYVLLAY